MEANIKYSASLPSAALWAQSTHAVAKQLHYGKSHNATGVPQQEQHIQDQPVSRSVGHSLLAGGHGRGMAGAGNNRSLSEETFLCL